MKPTATLRVTFEHSKTHERGALTFTGSLDFVVESGAPMAYLISQLKANFGATSEDWMRTGNELTQAWESAKQGKDFTGEIVSMKLV